MINVIIDVNSFVAGTVSVLNIVSCLSLPRIFTLTSNFVLPIFA